MRAQFVLAAAILAIAAHPARADSRFESCKAEAREISGYYGQERKSAVGSAVKGGLAGAAVGAAGGWVVGSSSGRAAKRGAALGVLVGGVKAAADNKDLEKKRATYERALEHCMSRKD